MKHDNSLLQCFPTRSPRNIVMGYANNRGITNQNFWRTARNSRHHFKYRGNCYPSTDNAGVHSVRYKLPTCFVVVSSYLRLCSAGLCVCVCVYVYMCARFVLLQSRLTAEDKKPTCSQLFRACKLFHKLRVFWVLKINFGKKDWQTLHYHIFTVSPCISIHYLYMFQQMHLLYYNTNFSVSY
jgi:hypothetical protein